MNIAVPSRCVEFHVLAKPTGAACNLECSYCFYLPKRELYPGSRFRMSAEVLETYIRELIESHEAPEVTIAWQGGEPTLMGLDFFRQSVRLADRYRKAGTQIRHSIQTNGTLLDDRWGGFLKQHDFLVGISIDGPRPVHDAFRRGRRGRPSFDRVMRGLEILRKHDVRFNTLTCLHSGNADYPLDLYRFLRDACGSRFLQFIPVVERAGESAVSERSIRPSQLGRFYIDMFDEWVKKDVGTVFVQMFDSTLANWVKAPPSMCVHAERCGGAVALEHNGDVYSCDHFVGPEHRLGNIAGARLLDLVLSPVQLKFGRNKSDQLPSCCRACDVRFACNGGCPKDRFSAAPDGEQGLNYLCQGFRDFFAHSAPAMNVMTQLLAQRRAPSEIMRNYAGTRR